MATHYFSEQISDPVHIRESDSKWIVTKTGAIFAGVNSGIDEVGGYSGNLIVVNGIVSVSTTYAAIYTTGQTTEVRVGAHGTLEGNIGLDMLGHRAVASNRGTINVATDAVAFLGEHVRFDNYGTLKGPRNGVFIHHDGTITNHEDGYIFSDGGVGVKGDGQEAVTLVNDGKIEVSASGTWGVQLGDGADKVTNDGLILGSVGLYGGGNSYIGKGGTIEGSLEAGDGNDHFDLRDAKILKNGNSGGTLFAGGGNDRIDVRGGSIAEYISAGAGNDTIDARDAKIGGTINGLEGNDTLIVDNARYGLVETKGQGTDTVRSSVSYKLDHYVEKLALLGTKNIDATGSVDDNTLTGNSGSNILKGLSGEDVLDGREGNDRLFGGAGHDTFGFATGGGKDEIADFDNDDSIYVANWKAIGDFGELKAHAEDHGKDVWITAGKDTLIIDHMHKADLHAGDFGF